MAANPYSPPKAALEARAAGGYRREGKEAVLPPGGTLPPRCVKCNEAALQPMKPRKLYWHHPGWFLLVFVNVLIYIIVALIVRRRAEVTYGVCAKHRLRRRVFIAVGWIGFVLSLMVIVVNPLAGLGGVLVAALAGIIGSRLAYPSRITKEEVRLRGCGEAFLASLESDARAPAAPTAQARAGLGRCPKCRSLLPIDAPTCLKCKTALAATP